MTTLLQPQKLPPANDGHVRDNLTADERLLKQAVARCLRAQVAEVYGKVEGGAKANAVPEKITKWDQEVMKEVRPIWFGLFKKGGDKALRNIRRFPKHARKMAVLSWAEMQASERVEVVEKGGPGSGNFGHEGRPGEVGGSGPGGGGSDEKKDSFGNLNTRVPGMLLTTGSVRLGEKGKTHLEAFGPDRYQSSIGRESIGFYFYPDTGIIAWWDSPDKEAAHSVQSELEAQGYSNISHRDKTDPLTTIEKQFTKSLKATPSIVIPEWIEDPDVLTALENEMFKFAHGINQTTADDLREELMAGMENGETIPQLANRISGLSDEWVEGWRSEMIARTETARAFSTGHIEAWRSTGVVDRKVWVAAGDACPFCQQMDGTVVELDENFLEKGDEQDVPWRGQEIVMRQDYSDVNGPPLHPNCRCVLVAELKEEGE